MATNTLAGRPAPDPKRGYRRVMLFLAILASGGNLLIPRVGLAALVIVMGVVFFGYLQTGLNRRKVPIYAWIGLVMALAFVRFNEIDVVTNLIRFSNFLMALILLKVYWDEGRSKLAGDLIFVVRPMIYQVILTVALALVVPGLFMTLQVGEVAFKTIALVFNYHSVTQGIVTLARPNGFFFEPGVLQIFLNIYLFLIMSAGASWRRRAPALFAVLLTQSTTGIVIACLIVGFFSIIPLFRKGSGYQKLLTIVIVAGLAVPLAIYAEQNIQEKLSGARMGSASARGYDLQSGLMLVAENPIIGIGFDHSEYLKESIRLNPFTEKLSSQNASGRNNTNGILIVLYSVGIPLGLVFLFGLFRQDIFPHKVLFALMMMLSLSSEPLSFTPFFSLFAFSGLTLRRKVRRPAAPAYGGPAQAWSPPAPQWTATPEAAHRSEDPGPVRPL